MRGILGTIKKDSPSSRPSPTPTTNCEEVTWSGGGSVFLQAVGLRRGGGGGGEKATATDSAQGSQDMKGTADGVFKQSVRLYSPERATGVQE